MTLPTSKSFRIVLPSLAYEDVARLRRYCQDCFSASAVFSEPGDAPQVIWLATRDRTRALLAHRRSARAVLAKLNINCSLRGIWMVLATEEAVRAAAATGNHHHQETSHGAANESSSTPREDGEAKVILLGRQARGAGKLSFEVMR